jgi:hypothetical protein
MKLEPRAVMIRLIHSMSGFAEVEIQKLPIARKIPDV